MLQKRIISAVFLLAFVLIDLLYFSPYAFAFSVAAVVVLGVWEWCQFAQPQRTMWRFLITGVSACLLCVVLYIYRSQINAGIVLTGSNVWLLSGAMVWWAIALFMVITYPTGTSTWSKSILWQLLFGFFTLVPFMLALVALRLHGYEQNPYAGLVLLLYVLILVWFADSGAYFCGKAFGKHKLLVTVSPNKTWEGLLGGVVLSSAVGAIFIQFTPQDFVLRQFDATVLFVMSLGTILISVLGDLTESMFKRQAGIKDSSQLIPGHGGILDRIDSLTAALPFFCLTFYWLSS